MIRGLKIVMAGAVPGYAYLNSFHCNFPYVAGFADSVVIGT